MSYGMRGHYSTTKSFNEQHFIVTLVIKMDKNCVFCQDLDVNSCHSQNVVFVVLSF